jgi:hypothetical protein
MSSANMATLSLFFVQRPLLLIAKASGSGQLFWHPPPFRDRRTDRRDRDLGRPIGDKGRKNYAERLSVAVGGAASEQEPETATDVLYAGRDAGIGRLEVEVVSLFETLGLCAEISG